MTRVPGVDTRRRVLRVALELFMSQGYDRTSLREISDRLGFSKAALYYHFKAKEDILEALAGDVLSDLERLMDREQENPDRGSESRARFVENLLGLLLDNRGVGSLITFECKAIIPSTFGERARNTFFRVHEILLPPSPSAEDRIRALAALGVIQSTVFHLSDVTSEELRRLVLPLTLTVLQEPRQDLTSWDVVDTTHPTPHEGVTTVS
jgi:AcrR family transcriptional regulator